MDATIVANENYDAKIANFVLICKTLGKFAAHLDKIVTEEDDRYVVQGDLWIRLLVERSVAGEQHQFVMYLTFGNDTAGALPNIKGGLPFFSCGRCRQDSSHA